MEQAAAKGIMRAYLAWLGEGCLLAGRDDNATRFARRALVKRRRRRVDALCKLSQRGPRATMVAMEPPTGIFAVD